MGRMVHGVLGVFAMRMIMSRILVNAGMARFVRRRAECSTSKSAADKGKRDREHE